MYITSEYFEMSFVYFVTCVILVIPVITIVEIESGILYKVFGVDEGVRLKKAVTVKVAWYSKVIVAFDEADLPIRAPLIKKGRIIKEKSEADEAGRPIKHESVFQDKVIRSAQSLTDSVDRARAHVLYRVNYIVYCIY